jgi:hypothetical protein
MSSPSGLRKPASVNDSMPKRQIAVCSQLDRVEKMMRPPPAKTSAVERIRCAFRTMRALQKKGMSAIHTDPAHLHARPGSEQSRLLGPGNNSFEVRNFEQTANRGQCNMKKMEKKTARIQSLEEAVRGPLMLKIDGVNNPGE